MNSAARILIFLALSGPASAVAQTTSSTRSGTEQASKAIYTFVEQMPAIVGGLDKYRQQLDANLTYPSEAYRNKAEGTVLVQFIVGTTGQLRQFKIVKSVHPQLDAEALRVVQTTATTWIPGKQNGQAVDVYYTVPVVFQRVKPSLPNPHSPTRSASTPPAIIIGTTDKYPHSVGAIYPGNPGGLSDIKCHFEKEMRYPSAARMRNIQGEVFVQCLIDSTGRLQKPVVIQSPDPSLNPEAVRLVQTLSTWKPARHQGHPSQVEVILPVMFSLPQQ